MAGQYVSTSTYLWYLPLLSIFAGRPDCKQAGRQADRQTGRQAGRELTERLAGELSG